MCLLDDFNLHELALYLHESMPVPPSLIEDALCSHSLDQIAYHPSRGNNYLHLVFCSKSVVTAVVSHLIFY